VHSSGYERRRRDWYGRLRRFLYGVLLLAASRGALAADPLADLGRHRAAPPGASAPQHVVLATLQGLVMIHAEAATHPSAPLAARQGYPRIALDTVSARLQEPGDAPRFSIGISDSRELRDGAGFDLMVPEIGNFHLNLYARRNARSEGRRWAVGSAGASGPRQGWSLGGTLDLVRTVDGGRHVAFVPEVTFDLSDTGATYLPFQASLRLAHWRSIADTHALEERVPQITFHWRL
jgi:hypothetical protein